MLDDALTPDLDGDRREPAADAAHDLAHDELERRRLEVARPHHEPHADHVDQDAEHAEPLVPVRELGERAGDDGGDAGGEEVRLAVKAGEWELRQ